MLELPWRYKLIFPFFIVIPLIINYSGSTSVIFVYPINLIFSSVDVGVLFLLYIVLLGIYCTNTINIYAGINGL
jgi:UDP-N-acetylglucosamine--dolichyl-phosphate N-acetylglucosaminephosphotransferase